MKKILNRILILSFIFSFTTCDDDESLEFTLQPDPEGLTFENTFANNYLLSNATMSNVAERFVFAPVDFGIATEVTYQLQGSSDNTNFNNITSTNETNIAVTVGNLLELADELGLDDDPNTTDSNGEPNNVGVVFLRIRAFAGESNATNTVENISDVVEFNIEILESGVPSPPIEMSSFGLIFFNGNTDPDTPLFTNGDGVHFGFVNLPGATGKIRENMDFAVNFGLVDGETTADTGDLMMGGFGNDIEFGPGLSTGTARVVFDLNNLTYSFETFDNGGITVAWGMSGGFNGFGGGGPDIRMTQDPNNPNIWVAANVLFSATDDGDFKFRSNDDFAVNFGFVEGSGSPSDLSGPLQMGGFGNNIGYTAGTIYNVTIDLTPGAETYELVIVP